MNISYPLDYNENFNRLYYFQLNVLEMFLPDFLIFYFLSLKLITIQVINNIVCKLNVTHLITCCEKVSHFCIFDSILSKYLNITAVSQLWRILNTVTNIEYLCKYIQNTVVYFNVD